MDVPEGAMWFIAGVLFLFAIFTLMLMIVVYEAALEAKEFFKRENQRSREEAGRVLAPPSAWERTDEHDAPAWPR